MAGGGQKHAHASDSNALDADEDYEDDNLGYGIAGTATGFNTAAKTHQRQRVLMSNNWNNDRVRKVHTTHRGSRADPHHPPGCSRHTSRHSHARTHRLQQPAAHISPRARPKRPAATPSSTIFHAMPSHHHIEQSPYRTATKKTVMHLRANLPKSHYDKVVRDLLHNPIHPLPVSILPRASSIPPTEAVSPYVQGERKVTVARRPQSARYLRTRGVQTARPASAAMSRGRPSARHTLSRAQARSKLAAQRAAATAASTYSSPRGGGGGFKINGPNAINGPAMVPAAATSRPVRPGSAMGTRPSPTAAVHSY